MRLRRWTPRCAETRTSKVSSKTAGQAKLSLLKTGAGTMKLDSVNTYTRTTVNNDGRLIVDGSMAARSHEL